MKGLLKACARFLEEYGSALANSHLIIVQHCLDDSAELVELLSQRGIRISAFLSRHDSFSQSTFEDISRYCDTALRLTGSVSPDEELCTRLLQHTLNTTKELHKLLILDLAGEFAGLAEHLAPFEARQVAGIVEDTTSGHLRYKERHSNLKVPVISVARSPLKEIEAVYVASAVVAALELCLHPLGLPFKGQHVTVIGYGMIGEPLSSSLRMAGYRVGVFDSSMVKLSRASTHGHEIGAKDALLSKTDIVISATGDIGLESKDFTFLKSGVVLASAGAATTELNVLALKSQSAGSRQLSEYSEEYRQADGKHFILLNGGKAINFLVGSVPNRIIDLVFTEILAAAAIIAQGSCPAGLSELPWSLREDVARIWLAEHALYATGEETSK